MPNGDPRVGFFYPTFTLMMDSSYPHAFLKKCWGYCNRLRPSVRPSRYLLLNHWTKFNQIWCVCCSHELGMQRHNFFSPAPWGPGEGPKGQIPSNIIKFQLQSLFERFFNQTLCVFSQMKDIKHIRWDFHLAAWVMPRGGTCEYRGGLGGQIFFLRNSTRFRV